MDASSVTIQISWCFAYRLLFPNSRSRSCRHDKCDFQRLAHCAQLFRADFGKQSSLLACRYRQVWAGAYQLRKTVLDIQETRPGGSTRRAIKNTGGMSEAVDATVFFVRTGQFACHLAIFHHDLLFGLERGLLLLETSEPICSHYPSVLG